MNLYPKVFIIILNYNGAPVLRACLNSVYKIDYPNFEVVVVDNNSNDGSLEQARKFFPKGYFIKNEVNLGFSAGNNVGIKYALEKMAEWILLLNQDTVVEKDFLTKLINFAGENRADIISPIIKDRNDKVWFAGGEIDWWKMKAKNITKIKRALPYETEFISGCAMLIKSSVFKKIGLLDEDYFLYWEDVDFSCRAKKAGFSGWIVPESRIVHLEKSEEKKANKIYWLVISGLIFFQKNTSSLMKIWIKVYCGLRKIKNWRDIRGDKNKINLAVRRAYDDFEKYAR